MGNRKENLKKSLGLTEYPWSSDDDEDIQRPPVPPVEEVLRRINRDNPVTSVADTPGPVAVPPPSEQASPATTRRIQARMDRDLFWSIINNTPRPTVNVQPTRSRISDPSLNSTSRSAGHQSRQRVEVRIPEQRSTSRRVDRQPASADVQRIIAFRKLTRSLHNLAQNRGPNQPTNRPNGTNQSSPRASRPHERLSQSRAVGPDIPRSTLFTPTVNQNRENYNYRLPWRRSLPTYPTSTTVSSLDDVTVDQVQPIVNTWHYQHDPGQPSPAANIDAPSTSQMPEPFVNIPDHSEDELQTVPPVVQKNEPRDENNENAEEDNEINEEPGHNETGSGARLIEEVVEVEARDEPDNNPPPPGTEGEDEPAEPNAENNNNSAETVNSEEAAEVALMTSQQAEPSYGVKRKRDSADEPNEPFSVQEFNQGLLRLLECPVCLEWMEPPISQCRRGHLVCSRCRTRLAACPVCRTPFSSVRNRAMEGVAEMLRYPCRHGCGREVRLRRRAPHEASCDARRYHCPAPVCARHPPLPRDELAHHFQCKHLPILKIGGKHKFSMKVNSEQHDTWLIMTLDQYFHLRVDVDIRTWGVIVYVAYIGPKRNAKYYNYEVTVEGQHNSRKLVYTRTTHSDLESSSVNVSRQDCFHLTLDQALNFLRFKNRHCEPDKFLDFDVEITKWESVDDSRDDSES